MNFNSHIRLPVRSVRVMMVGLVLSILLAAGSSSPTGSPAASTKPTFAIPATQSASTKPNVSLTALLHKLNTLMASGQPHDKAWRQAMLQLAGAVQPLVDEQTTQGAQLVAYQIQCRVYSELAQQAVHRDDLLLASLRLHQLRSVAGQMTELAPAAKPMGDFWKLQADLIDLKLDAYPPAQHQQRAITRLGAFVAEHPFIAHAEEGASRHPLNSGLDIRLAVRQALLRLDLQTGRLDQAKELLDAIGQTKTADGDLMARARRACALRCKSAAFSVKTDDGRMWSLSDHRGSVVLVTVVAAGSKAGKTILDDLKSRYAELSSRGLVMLTVVVEDSAEAKGSGSSDATRGREATAWVGAEDSLLKTLEVRTVPEFVIIDGEGRIATVGHSPAVLDRLDRWVPKLRPG